MQALLLQLPPRERDALLQALAADWPGQQQQTSLVHQQGQQPQDPRLFRHCGRGAAQRGLALPEWEAVFAADRVTLVTVNMNSPLSFLNSAKSWSEAGLLDMVDERIAVLSNSSALEVAIAAQFRFKVIRPRDVDTEFRLGEDAFALSTAFYFGLQLARNDRKRNWYAFYCATAASADKIQRAGNTCVDAPPLPPFKCFTSRDSNWSLNACLVRRSRMQGTQFSFELPAAAGRR